MELLLKAIKNTKLGQSFDNLLTETMKDGFKSKCVVASYFCVFRCCILCLVMVFVMLIIYAIGVFTNAPVNGDIMIEFIKVVKDTLIVILGFFAIAVTTTFGATYVESRTPNTATKIETAPQPPKEG